MCVCVCVCVRVCVRACVRACVCVSIQVHACVSVEVLSMHECRTTILATRILSILKLTGFSGTTATAEGER